ncbi:polyubiquitin 8 [Cinnamomum micranthum f. kanehirae]|uniref:Polyubiquitin 8 n=1 Tax=Cinnamomum micranthum f. kanehirae TaxID=337451 RepID=A0A3S3R4G3_9MAGN|nr:polyubiquitin 8 [Cinnamomum micranthum f. kanehirae]
MSMVCPCRIRAVSGHHRLQPLYHEMHQALSLLFAKLRFSYTNRMHIVIVTEGGEHPIEVDPMETTAEVKQNLEGLLSIPARRQTLSCDQPDFFDFMTMDFLGVKENDRIVLTINSKENRYKIIVKISARVISLDVEEMDTVASLKNKIQESIGGLNIEQITLFYKDSKMRDNGRLCEYKLGMNSEIIATLDPVTHSSSAMMLASPKRFEFCGGSSSFLKFNAYPSGDGRE